MPISPDGKALFTERITIVVIHTLQKNNGRYCMHDVFFATAGQAAPNPTMAPRFQHKGNL